MHCGFYSAFILSAANGRVLWAAAFETEGRCGGSLVIARLPFQQPLLCLERDGKGFWQLFRLYRLHERPLSLASKDNICHSSSTLRQWVQRRCIDSEHGVPLLAGPMTEESLLNFVIKEKYRILCLFSKLSWGGTSFLRSQDLSRKFKRQPPYWQRRERWFLKGTTLANTSYFPPRDLWHVSFFPFKANVERLFRRDLKPLNFELKAECKAI